MRFQFALAATAVAICPVSLPAELRFRHQEIDQTITIGYGVAVADVDGDRKPDILLADKRQFVWYRNPSWEKFLLAENLTAEDNVCLAAADLDGDGQAEVAVGAGWNPADTVHSGALFFLQPPPDRTQRWRPIRLEPEPTVHRMRWFRNRDDRWLLAVLPLHGRANREGRGQGVRFLGYEFPAKPENPWTTRVIDDSLHVTHNFDLVRWTGAAGDELLLAAREGIFHLVPRETGWQRRELAGTGTAGFAGASEVRAGTGPNGVRFVVTVEPFHGNQLVLYTPGFAASEPFGRKVLDPALREGHALACGDLLGRGSDQVVVGWRQPNAHGVTGIQCWIPGNRLLDDWQSVTIDTNRMACEDLCLADLNGDGRLDIVAAGRATRNVKIYLNEGGK